MIKLIKVPVASEAINKVGDILIKNRDAGTKTIVFCDDSLTFVLEKMSCDVYGGGLFDPFIYTFPQFLNLYGRNASRVLSRQDSVMILGRLIENNKGRLTCYNSVEYANSVFDVMSQLYSSNVHIMELKGKKYSDDLLERKLDDIVFLYEKYVEYLKAGELTDMNEYLSTLPAVVKDVFGTGNNAEEKYNKTDFIFVGYRTFSHAEAMTVSVCTEMRGDTYGIVVEQSDSAYSNGAETVFRKLINDDEDATECVDTFNLAPEAEMIRTRIFEVETFSSKSQETALKTDKVHLFEAGDEEEELEYVAVEIRRIVAAGGRYGDISLMAPDTDGERPHISRVFSRFRIPYYIDGKMPLAECPICSFLIDILSSRADGYYPDTVDALISNPLFKIWEHHGKDGKDFDADSLEATERIYKDDARNYVMHLADYRDGITELPDEEHFKELGYSYKHVSTVIGRLTALVNLIPSVGTGEEYDKALKKVLYSVQARDKLRNLAEKYKDECPSESALYDNAYHETIAIVNNACELVKDEKITVKEFLNHIKNVLLTDKVSLFPPKHDAVRVGDISRNFNISSKYLFAVGMTNEVPHILADESVLNDDELAKIEDAIELPHDNELGGFVPFVKFDADNRRHPVISPKNRDVNEEYRETVRLNLCSFTEGLFLCYPICVAGKDNTVPSDAISYVDVMFRNEIDGSEKRLKILNMKEACKDKDFLSYFCTEKSSAIKTLLNNVESGTAVEKFLQREEFLNEDGVNKDIDTARSSNVKTQSITPENASGVFAGNGSISPTALENWFSCPYKAFMERGLGVQERKTSRDIAKDIGTFVHAVLQSVFDPNAENGYPHSQDGAEIKAREECAKLISHPKYAVLLSRESGKYTRDMLVDETVKLCLAVQTQLENSEFKITGTEENHELKLDDITVEGRIDRIDTAELEDETLVRVIDYKTGTIAAKITEYYMGIKLQPELYLNAVSDGKTPVGIYYLPASISFSNVDGESGEDDEGESDDDTGGFDEDVSPIALKGFTRGDDKYLEISDTTLKGKAQGEKSVYLRSIKKQDFRSNALVREEHFNNFLEYSKLVSDKAATDIVSGYIYPTPAYKTCGYCPYSGICGYRETTNGGHRTCYPYIKSKFVSEIVESTRNDNSND